MPSVVLEVGVQRKSFELGSVLAPPESVRIEIERSVPAGGADALAFWAAGRDREQLARELREDPRVAALFEQSSRQDRTLYRIEWADPPDEFVGAVRDASGAILRARCDDDWLFRLRFPDHERLSSFHETCSDRDLPLRVERIDPDHDADGPSDQFGLSTPQREALVLALERGYFATPSEASLADLAEELDISHQAVSSRIRRGLSRVLPTVLFTAQDERDEQRTRTAIEQR